MSGTLRIKTELAMLPYREMRELGKDISSLLEVNHLHTVPCETLSEVMSGLVDVPASQEADAERDILAKCFNRKRAFTIQPYENGFKISAASLDSVIYAYNIREGISQMLDQIVAVEVLSK